MLTVSDWAGSGFKTCQAIARHTEHDIHLIALKGNAWGHPRQTIINKKNFKRLQQRVNESDIIHLKGDWPPTTNYIGLNITTKPIVSTVSGGFFRKKPLGQERYTPSSFRRAVLRTAMTPDLLYPEFSNIWTPHPIDSIGKPNIWEMSDPPILVHSPTDRKAKDTEFILKVFDKLEKKVKFERVLIEDKPFHEAEEMRKQATIFFDSFKQGSYANSAIEAMQYGIPASAYISPLAREQAKNKLDDCPVMSWFKDVNIWAKQIEWILTHDMNELSKKNKKWCDEIHSYHTIAKLWDKLYKSI